MEVVHTLDWNRSISRGRLGINPPPLASLPPQGFGLQCPVQRTCGENFTLLVIEITDTAAPVSTSIGSFCLLTPNSEHGKLLTGPSGSDTIP